MPDSDRDALLANAHIRLSGIVDQDMYDSFRKLLQACPADGPMVISINTLGGDHEMARVMGDDVGLLREQDGRQMMYLGKVADFETIRDRPPENWYIDCEEAIKLGLIHDVIEPPRHSAIPTLGAGRLNTRTPQMQKAQPRGMGKVPGNTNSWYEVRAAPTPSLVFQ